MESFSKYFKTLLNQVGYQKENDFTIEEVRFILSKTNEYFYTYSQNLGTTFILEDNYEYFSEFHKFWEKYHRQILNPTIIENKCNEVVEILNKLYLDYGKELYYELYDTFALNPDEICLIRYFSANQDFRGSRDFADLARIYSDDPTIFDVRKIYNDPEDFLRRLKLLQKSYSGC